MPRVAFRLSEVEHQQLLRDARVQGKSVSELVRDALRLTQEGSDYGERIEDLERRVGRLEGVAGLE